MIKFDFCAWVPGAGTCQITKSIVSPKIKMEKGKLADFIIVDTDLMKAEPMALYTAKVLYTFVGGEKVHEKK